MAQLLIAKCNTVFYITASCWFKPGGLKPRALPPPTYPPVQSIDDLSHGTALGD